MSLCTETRVVGHAASIDEKETRTDSALEIIEMYYSEDGHENRFRALDAIKKCMIYFTYLYYEDKSTLVQA